MDNFDPPESMPTIFLIKVHLVTVVAGITFQWSDVDGSFVLDENLEEFGFVKNGRELFNDLMIDYESADEIANDMEMTFDEFQHSLLEGELF